MASQKNPNQIVRKDGKNCFVEVMSSAFDIGKVLMNFVSYNTENQTGSKITANISIYLSFDEFYRLCHDITVTRSIIKEILTMAEAAKREGKRYAPQKVLCMGGRSAASLAAAGVSRADGKSLSRQMKICAGEKLPIILSAESGPGEQSDKGLIVPKYQQPEQRVMIGFTYETIEELMLITKAHVDAYISAKYTYLAFHPEEKSAYSKNESKSTAHSSPAPQTSSDYYHQEAVPSLEPVPYYQPEPQPAPQAAPSGYGQYVEQAPHQSAPNTYGSTDNYDVPPIDMDIFNAMSGNIDF